MPTNVLNYVKKSIIVKGYQRDFQILPAYGWSSVRTQKQPTPINVHMIII